MNAVSGLRLAPRLPAPDGVVFGRRYRALNRLKNVDGVDTLSAVDVTDGSKVIVKTTSASKLPPGPRMRLEHEVEVLAKLDSPEIGSFLTMGRERDLLYLVRGFIPGVTLRDRLADGPLPVTDALMVGCSLMAALELAHANGVLHRDVKPANVIIDPASPPGQATLIDFGLARSARLDSSIRDRAVGTARYVSPEQAGVLDSDVDERSDLYSAGIVLFECLTGRPPFDGDSVGELLRHHLSTPAPALRDRGRQVPRAVEQVVQRLLDKDPATRYQSAGAALADLREIADALAHGVTDPDVVAGLHDRRRTLADPAFFGRGLELAALELAIERSRTGEGGLVLMEAESGGGKTRLLDELAYRTATTGIRVLRGRGVSQVGARPFQVLTGVVHALADEAASDATLAPALRARLGSSAFAAQEAFPELGATLDLSSAAAVGPEEYGETRALNALALLLDNLGSADRPALVLLDDCHWADELTVKLLDQWSRSRAGARHVCLVAAFGSEDVPAEHLLRQVHASAELRLPAFRSADVRQLVESMAGPLPVEAVELVERLSEGSPFMASAILRGLVEGGALTDETDGWRLKPLTMGEAKSFRQSGVFLTRRLELLPPSVLTLLNAAAVLGKGFDLELAADVAGQPAAEAVAAVDIAKRRRIVWVDQDGTRCSFVHDKLRESVLDRLDENDRKQLHHRVAERIEHLDASRVYELAYHLAAAAEPCRAMPYALAAASQARARGSLEVAERHYRMAQQASIDGSARREIAEGLGHVLMLRGSYDEALSYLEDARALSGDDTSRARADRSLAELAFKRGDVAAGAEANERALRLLGHRAPRRVTAAAAWLLWEIFVQVGHTLLPRLSRGRRSLHGAERELLAVDLFDRLLYSYWFVRGPVHALWAHLRGLNLAERYSPTPELAKAYASHAAAVSAAAGAVMFDRCRASAERSLAIWRDHGDLWGEGQALHCYGIVFYARAEYAEAAGKMRAALELLHRAGDPWEANTAAWHIGYCHYRLGDLAAADETARQVYEAGAEIGDPQARGISLSVWSKATGGQVPRQLVRQELARGTGDAHTAVEVMQAEALRLLGIGKPDEAVQLLEQATATLRKAHMIQVYVAPVFAWLATARRLAVESVSVYGAPNLRSERRRWYRAARRSLVVASLYRNDLPHALREAALAAAARGRTRRSNRLFAKSLTVAELQDATAERARTLCARGKVGAELGWPGADEDLAQGRDILARIEVRLSPGDGAEAADSEQSTLSLRDRFASVLDAGRRLASALDREAVFDAVRTASLELLRGERCVVLSAEFDDDFAAVSGEIDVAADDLRGRLVAKALSSGHPVVASSDLLAGDSSSAPPLSVVRSALCAPITVRNQPAGCFYVSHSLVSDLFGDEAIRLAGFIATLAGAALENADGFAEVQSLTRTSEHRVEQRTTELAAANRRLDVNLNKLQEAYQRERQAAEELKHQAFHDAVTGLANRVLFRERLEHALVLRRRDPRPLAVLFLDLDDFKIINDNLGHAAGDQLLISVADTLSRCIRSADTVARFGGDEFAILLEELADGDDAALLAARLIDALRAPYQLHGREVRTQVSIGITITDNGDMSGEELLRDADTAMYAAKAQGKGRFEIFDPTKHEAAVGRLVLRAALENAIEHELAVHYQPFVELATGQIKGVEALVRWDRPGIGLIPPQKFIPMAEETGIIVSLGRWVLERACRQAVSWHEVHWQAGLSTLSVNLSVRQLQDPQLVADVEGIVATTGMDPHCLILEVTESVLMSGFDAAIAAVTLSRLKELGVRLAIDDFGSGYASLQYLKQFPVDILKIDMSLVQEAVSSAGTRRLVGAIVQFAHALDLEVVAEGIENADQHDQMRAMLCDLGQGYLYARPLDDEGILRLLSTGLAD